MRVLRRSPSEAEFQRQVIEAAELLGWKEHHTHDSRRSPAGWPDLVLVRPPRLLFLELKMPGRQLTPAQRAWLKDLQACGREAYVAYPKDWENLMALLQHPGRDGP